MIRGDRMSVRAIATRCRMPPESSLGYFRASRLTSSPTLAIHSRARSRRSARRNTATFETERDVVFDGPVVERRVVLKHHPAIGARPFDRLLRDQHLPSLAGWCGAQSRDQPQHRRLAAAGGPENGDELAFARPVFDLERDVADDREISKPLGHATELDDAWDIRPSRWSFLDSPVREQAALEEEQDPVDRVGERADDQKDQDDVLRKAAPLARHQQDNRARAAR